MRYKLTVWGGVSQCGGGEVDSWDPELLSGWGSLFPSTSSRTWLHENHGIHYSTKIDLYYHKWWYWLMLAIFIMYMATWKSYNLLFHKWSSPVAWISSPVYLTCTWRHCWFAWKWDHSFILLMEVKETTSSCVQLSEPLTPKCGNMSCDNYSTRKHAHVHSSQG